jgi:Bromodomain
MEEEIPRTGEAESSDQMMNASGPDNEKSESDSLHTPTKAVPIQVLPNSEPGDEQNSKSLPQNERAEIQEITSSKKEQQDPEQQNTNLQQSNSKTEVAQPSLWFETILNSQEMEYLQKLLPKGYSLTTQFRASRPRAARNVDLSQTIEFKDDPLPKRPPRLQSSRFRSSEISYGPPKYSKNVSDLVKKCFKIVTQLQKHQYSRPFLKPVDPIAEGIPDYFDIVKEPMDLSKVDKRLRSGSYINPMQFAADVRKIWSNAILYNPRKSAIYYMTVQMSNYFEQIYKSVEENPFPEPPNEYVQNRVNKIEQKLLEIKNGTADPEEQLSKPMGLDEKKKLAIALRGKARYSPSSRAYAYHRGQKHNP